MKTNDPATSRQQGMYVAPPQRDYSYDPSFAETAGQPPFTILVGRIFLWQKLDS